MAASLWRLLPNGYVANAKRVQYLFRVATQRRTNTERQPHVPQAQRAPQRSQDRHLCEKRPSRRVQRKATTPPTKVIRATPHAQRRIDEAAAEAPKSGQPFVNVARERGIPIVAREQVRGTRIACVDRQVPSTLWKT
jgi:hypothetical protein